MHVLLSFLCTVRQIDCLTSIESLYFSRCVWTDICTLYLFYVSEINIYYYYYIIIKEPQDYVFMNVIMNIEYLACSSKIKKFYVINCSCVQLLF